MADAGNEAMKGREENSDGNLCSATAVQSIDHTATRETNDTGLLGESHSVPTSKNETKTGVLCGRGSAGDWSLVRRVTSPNGDRSKPYPYPSLT